MSGGGYGNYGNYNPNREIYKGSAYSTEVLDKAMKAAGLNAGTGYDLVLEMGFQVDKGKISRVGNKNKYISGPEFARAAKMVNKALDGQARATKTVMRVMTEMMRKQ